MRLRLLFFRVVIGLTHAETFPVVLVFCSTTLACRSSSCRGGRHPPPFSPFLLAPTHPLALSLILLHATAGSKNDTEPKKRSVGLRDCG